MFMMVNIRWCLAPWLVGLLFVACGGSDNGNSDLNSPDAVTQKDVSSDIDDVVASDTDAIVDGDVQIPIDGVHGDASDTEDVELPPTDATNYAIVTTDELLEAATAFATYRESTGYRTVILKISDMTGYGSQKISSTRAEIKSLREALPAGYPLFVLLLGAARDGSLPAADCENELGDCNTDNAYVDFDEDGLPDAAVGRVPATSNDVALAYLDKVKTHETTYTIGEHNRSIGVYTGQAEFSAEIDALLETAVMEGLKLVSHLFDIKGLYNNTNSSYYYMPFEEKVVDLFNEGVLMMIYIGHGSTDWTEGLDPDHIDLIHCTKRLPLMFFFSCLNGNYVGGTTPSMAEQLLWKVDGPVTAVGASDISHPYGNAILAYETQRIFLDERLATVGEGFEAVRRAVIEHTDDFRSFLDGVAVIEVPKDEQATIRSEHVNLYNLFGDPACLVRYPQGLASLEVTAGGVSAKTISIRGETSGLSSGSAHVTLEVERDRMVETLDDVDPDNPDQATVQANWEKANNKVVVGATVPVTAGVFETTLDFPNGLSGNIGYVKVYAWDENVDRFGMLRITP